MAVSSYGPDEVGLDAFGSEMPISPISHTDFIENYQIYHVQFTPLL